MVTRSPGLTRSCPGAYAYWLASIRKVRKAGGEDEPKGRGAKATPKAAAAIKKPYAERALMIQLEAGTGAMFEVPYLE